MSTPRRPAVTSRLNTGGYGVTVRAFGFKETWVKRGGWGGHPVTLTREVMPQCVVNPGTVNPDGSLSVEPEPWAARHYRRAVMRGAGVYQAGLWAMLAQRAQHDPAQVVEGAALGGNDAQVLDRFTGHLPRVKAFRVWRTCKRFRKYVQILQGLTNHTWGEKQRVWRLKAEARTVAYHHPPTKFESSYFGETWFLIEFDRLLYKRYLLSVGHSLSTSLRVRYAEITAVMLWQVHREHSHSVTRERPPARVPRPIHAQPRPPAAPLAPPAL